MLFNVKKPKFTVLSVSNVKSFLKTPIEQLQLVDFGGQSFIVPKWVRYMAVDESGEVWMFANKPHGDKGDWFPDGLNLHSTVVQLCICKYKGNPQYSLVKVKDQFPNHVTERLLLVGAFLLVAGWSVGMILYLIK